VINVNRRRLMMALATAPLAVAVPRSVGLSTMSVGEVIAWLHFVGLRRPDPDQA